MGRLLKIQRQQFRLGHLVDSVPHAIAADAPLLIQGKERSVVPKSYACIRLSRMVSFKSEKYFAEIRRCQMEVVHCFIPHRDFCAWHITRDRPVVRFTFDE